MTATIPPPPSPRTWQREQARLWHALVPVEGPAPTLQGELIRLSGNLTNEACAFGNFHWNQDHERHWRFIGRHLDDAETFTDAERMLIREKVEQIIREHAFPDAFCSHNSYDAVTEKVVRWCLAHPIPIPYDAATRTVRASS